MRILQSNKRYPLGNYAERNWISCSFLQTEAFDTNASTTVSDCDERAGKMGWIEVAGAFAPGAVSPVHHRFAHFRQRHMDANDGPKLGDEHAN